MMVKGALELLRISVTRIRAFNTCRRLHHFQYELRYRPVIDRESAEFGSIMHKGCEAWWLAWAGGRELLALEEAQTAIAKAAQTASFFDEGTAAKADLLMLGYHARWAPTMGEWEVIAVEQKFAAPMPTPAGAKRVRGLRVVGKMDVLVRRRADGTVWIVEHKFTTADLTPGSTYWQRLRMDTQVSVYFEGTKILGYEPVGCLYDVVLKPEQRPLKATPEDKREYTKEGKLYAKQRAEDETMEAFKSRIAALIVAAPEEYFQRSEVVRLDHELEESRRDTYDTAILIREARNGGRAPRNPDSCFLYNRVCQFYPVCSGTAQLEDPALYRKLDDPHPELANDNAGDDGKAA
jgi:PD-(D/E)XK nuclease superfamily protein